MLRFFCMSALLLSAALISLVQCVVLDLDDSFVANRGDKAWLVKFYAPWCGHCKKLEPVWTEVDRYLKQADSDVIVARLDATRFSSVASLFDVHGYPTIKFIQGEKSMTYKGDRFRDNIVEFALRAYGPVVRWLSNTAKLHEVHSDLSTRVFFLYIGPEDETDPLYKAYGEAAAKQRIHSYFYAGLPELLHSRFKKKYETTVLVFKDKQYYEYEVPVTGPTTESLEKFIISERMLPFPKMTPGGLNELFGINKKVVLIVTKSRMQDDPKEERMKQLGKILATQYRDNYHNDFQFIWMNDPDTGNSITMSRPETPYLLVWDLETNMYYLPETGFDVHTMTVESAHTFLDDVRDGKIEPLGGNSFKQRVKRFLYDISVVVYSIYQESVWLALVVFGVPSLVISIICYALCCLETVEETEIYEEIDRDQANLDNDESEEDEKPLDGHEKTE